MLKYFPLPYPDEILYSTIARLLKHLGTKSVYDILVDIFGKNRTAIRDIPIGLQGLLDNSILGRYFSGEDLVVKHTLFPLYTAFVGAEKRKKLLQHMLGDGPTYRWDKLAFYTSICSANSLRFCPECINADIEKFGEPYWHRSHQFPGVSVCNKHEILLEDACLDCCYRFDEKDMEYLCLDSECPNGHSLSKSIANEPAGAFELQYSKNVYVLLANPICYEEDEIQDIYTVKLQYSGLANLNGVVQTGKVAKALEEHYGNRFLEQMQSLPHQEIDKNWVYNLFRKCRTTQHIHPLRHLLFTGWLFEYMDEFFAAEPVFRPFGTGPWPCLNHTCYHYKENIIKDCILNKGTKTPVVGVFQCNECGFKYTRSGPESKPVERFQLSSILEFGHVWENKLYELYFGRGYSLSQVARELGTNTHTVKRYVEIYDSGTPINKEQLTQNQIRDGYRKVIINTKNDFPNITRNDMRRTKSREYIWLYRFDREWLGQELPELPRTKPHEKIDWRKRDLEICQMIPQLVSEILRLEGFPQRITKETLIGRLRPKVTGFSYFNSKLPNTIKTVKTYLESQVEYYERCVMWAIEELRKDGIEVNEVNVLIKSKVPNKEVILKVVREKIKSR